VIACSGDPADAAQGVVGEVVQIAHNLGLID